MALLLFTGAVVVNAQQAALTEDARCGCYLIKRNETTYFKKHRFFDFRNHDHHASVPPVIESANDSPDAPVTSPFFNSTDWTDFWMISNWNNSHGVREDSTLLMVNSPNNVYLEANPSPNPSSPSKSWLSLRTQRLPKFQTTAEIESLSAKFKFVSIRMLARTIGARGAITAMFTYRHSEELAKVQESDLEIRTSDPKNLIHCTNQPSLNSEGDIEARASRNATMPDGLEWSDWAVHRLDWTPESTTWYVNDVEVADIAFQTPKDVSNIILNAWSDGGEWTENMTVGEAAYLQLQWFEILYNTTEVEKREGGEGGCNSVCSVDGSPEVGRPVMLWSNGVGRVVGMFGGWVMVTVVAVLFLVA
ncbi:concanavalin A-like lectin/glucanase domain-containing protein [Triangularia verruculosa]|uniref:Concanavalin A-like lectin/glucanase domain-containing protein n=1 Tax=Triangularia verruculosa TaxID=2587418 RepID=A0AAN7AY36_9PEZI|nr:concanavalin A-like lectin/glucanase domain-containing protein [Triangularia verruculosa]